MSTEIKGMERILEVLTVILSRTRDKVLTTTRRNVLFGQLKVDADCTVNWLDGQCEILIKYSEKGLPGIIRREASRLRSLRHAFAHSNALPVFAAPFITDDGMDVCREEGIGCIDEAGNCLLPMPGAYIEIRGRRNARPEVRGVRSAYSPKSSRIIRLLLSDIGKCWQVQELASMAGISIGLVSRIKRNLLDEDLIVEENRCIRVRSARDLIDAWTRNYKFSRNGIDEYYSLDDLAKLEGDIAGWCNANDIRYALGLFSAAARIAPHVRMNKVFLFVDIDPGVIAVALGLKRVSTGANVVLLKPYDQGVFQNGAEYGGMKVVSDVQTYIDLKTYRGRGEEAAEFLMKEVLEKRWAHDQSMVSGK